LKPVFSAEDHKTLLTGEYVVFETRCAEKRDVIRRMAREALEEDERNAAVGRSALIQSRTTRQFWRQAAVC
jgi:hypothetical protein